MDLTGRFRFMAQLSKYDCDRKTKENEGWRKKEKKRTHFTHAYTCHIHVQTSAGSFERGKTLSNFQFSQSGPKIRDHAPVMAEVQWGIDPFWPPCHNHASECIRQNPPPSSTPLLAPQASPFPPLQLPSLFPCSGSLQATSVRRWCFKRSHELEDVTHPPTPAAPRTPFRRVSPRMDIILSTICLSHTARLRNVGIAFFHGRVE